MNKILESIIIFLYIFTQIDTFEKLQLCKTSAHCYGTKLCDPILQNRITPEYVSKMICFKNNASNFIMGTDKPIFKSDGEGPCREVLLDKFCIDLTQVSNLQFLQFTEETNYRTEVSYFSCICEYGFGDQKSRNYNDQCGNMGKV